MKKHIRYFFLLISIMLFNNVNAGAHTPGQITISDNSTSLNVIMNFKHNPNTLEGAYLKIDNTHGITVHIGAYDGVRMFGCDITKSTNPQLYADAMMILPYLPASSSLYVTGPRFGECTNFTFSNSSMFGEDKIIVTQ